MNCLKHNTIMVPGFYCYGTSEDGAPLLCPDCLQEDSGNPHAGEMEPVTGNHLYWLSSRLPSTDPNDDASLLETEPLLIAVSTDDGREWINAGDPGDMTTLQEVTSPRTGDRAC